MEEEEKAIFEYFERVGSKGFANLQVQRGQSISSFIFIIL